MHVSITNPTEDSALPSRSQGTHGPSSQATLQTQFLLAIRDRVEQEDESMNVADEQASRSLMVPFAMLTAALPSFADNGVLALARPVDAITVDGDFLDRAPVS